MQTQRPIEQHNILENYSESIHGEGLLKKGLIVAPNCASCHTPHSILPHTDPNSSIARKNITATCTKCHGLIEQVHRRRPSAANFGKKKRMCCRRASIVTSPTRSETSSTPRAWLTPTASAAMPGRTWRHLMDVRSRSMPRSWQVSGTPRWRAASATPKWIIVDVSSLRTSPKSRLPASPPVTASTRALIWGARNAVIQSSSAGRSSSVMRALVSMPRSPTKQMRASPNRPLSFWIWAVRVLGSAVLPSKTSMAMGEGRSTAARRRSATGP